MSDRTGIFAGEDPFEIARHWLTEAEKVEPNDPNAIALATVDANGLPNARMVLLKDIESDAFVFYTNFESAKARELDSSGTAAFVMHWKSLRRQVRVRGIVSREDGEQADAYYKSRPRDSRIGAWASQQSRPLESRFALEKAVARYAAKYAIGDVPRPPYWSGFRVKPVYIEFWKDGAFRLHDRVVFRRDGDDDAWTKSRLYP